VSQKLAIATECIKSLRQLLYSWTRRNERANEKSSYSDRSALPLAQTFQSSSRLLLYGLPFLLWDRTKGNEFSEWALLFIFTHCSSTRRHGLAKITPASQLDASHILLCSQTYNFIVPLRRTPFRWKEGGGGEFNIPVLQLAFLRVHWRPFLYYKSPWYPLTRRLFSLLSPTRRLDREVVFTLVSYTTSRPAVVPHQAFCSLCTNGPNARG
jgi:hypothetical protein